MQIDPVYCCCPTRSALYAYKLVGSCWCGAHHIAWPRLGSEVTFTNVLCNDKQKAQQLDRAN